MFGKLKTIRVALIALLALVATAMQAQTVTGNVKDNLGEAVIGATVMEVGTKNGTVTDIDGNFSLKLQHGGNLNISYVGMKAQVIKTAGKTNFSVVMEDDANTLGDIVVVGYGTMKKNDVTGSVSSVSTEDLNKKGAPSVMENLQGATPGVNITQSSGRTGGSFNIEIRGKSSVNSSTIPLFVVDGVMCDDIDWLNPQDIERIDVLKDASSTAIYGSRATAGVVMVTTKSGSNVKKQEKATISYDGYYGWSQTARMPDFMDGNSWYNYRFAKFLGYGALATSGNLTNMASPVYGMTEESVLQQCLLWNGSSFVMKDMLAAGSTTDWPSLFTSNGSQQNHYVAVSGSSEKINYHMGVGYNGQQGMYKQDKQNRINFKGSVDAKISKVVSAGFSMNLARQKNDYANDDAINVAYRMNPYMIPYYRDLGVDSEGNAIDNIDLDGNVRPVGSLTNFPGNKYTLGTTATGNQFSDTFNPLMTMNNTSKQRETWRALGNFYVQLDLMKGLNFKTTFSPNYSYYREGYYQGYEDPYNPGHTLDVTSSSPYIQVPMTDDYTWSKASYTTNRSFQWTWDNIINWNKTFADVHSLGVMGLFSMQASNTEKTYWLGTNTKLVGSDWWAMQNLTHNADESYTSYTENSMISYAVRANYSLMDKYLLTATARWDGSSKFAKDYRWGCFPSVALAWRVTEEDFMKKVDWVSNLKLRLSYGVTGNNVGVGNYETQSTVSRYNTYPLAGIYYTGYVSSGIIDEMLQWEKSHEFNVGLDFGFLRNRISGSIDWYTKQSNDLLYSVSLPLEAGVDSSDKPLKLTTNVGKVRNTGVEIALTGVIIDTKDLNWSVTANWSTNKNEIKEINGVSESYIDGSNPQTKSLFVGHSVNEIWAYNWAGIVSDRDMVVPNNEAATNAGLTPGATMKEYEYYNKVYGLVEGQPIIEDVDGNGAIDQKDRKYFRGDPKWSGTLSTSVSYKGFDFGATLYAKVGQNSYSPFLNSDYYNYADRGRQKMAFDYYIPAGTLIDCDGVNADGTYINPVYQEYTHYGEYPFPNNASSNNGLGTYKDQWDEAKSVAKTSFAKVKNITLGYTFPKTLLKPWGCQYLRLYFTVTNPFVFTNYKGFDPEWATASTKNDGPSSVTYQIGASIKF